MKAEAFALHTLKLWHVVLLTGVFALPAFAQEATPSCDDSAYSIQISVRNIKNDRGQITVDLHGDDPATFLKSGAKLARLRVPAVKGEMQICMPVEKPGIYALALYHDRDSDQQLNKTWIGLPSEPYGVSRDAPIRGGPPKHKDAAFEVTGAHTPITVTLR